MMEFVIAILLVLVLLAALFSVKIAFGQQHKFGALAIQLENLTLLSEKNFARIEREFREEIARSRSDTQTQSREERDSLAASLDRVAKSVTGNVGQLGALQGKQLETFALQLNRLTQSNDQRFDQLRQSVELKLSAIQADNATRLEEMRKTVDEKLHSTLEQRLGDSFKLVSDRLELVHKGLGEMQTLASGVGDLKRVLTNVKTRGTWGEVQLEALLEQVLTSEQYAKNVATRPNSSERVEFAIRLPGAKDRLDTPVWLPIDAKFPLEDYQRLLDAQELGDTAAVEIAAKSLELRLRDEAKKIREKYVEPPLTTDFAILYLPTEGLYAEALRRPGLAELLQREQRITLAGPTTLAALLNSLQMGFRTLAIEKRSAEVWMVLGAVKTEFGKFGEVLEATRKKLELATKSIESAGVRTRQIERKLKGVEILSVEDAKASLGALEEIIADAE